MRFITITVGEEGVLRVDVFTLDQRAYPSAVEFHRVIAPEISELDQAIKRKFQDLPEPEKMH